MSLIARALAVFCLLSSLAACTLPGRDCSRPEVFCVGLVTNTARLRDHGMNQSAWTGLQQALRDGLLDKADVIESMEATDYTKNIEAFAEDGYDVIVTSGAALGEATLQAARRYPAIAFIGLDQEPSPGRLANFTAVVFAHDQGGFLAGALAAHQSETGVIGAVCETSGIDFVWRTCEGFRAGAQYADPKVTAMIEYHEPESAEDMFTDETWGRQFAREIIRQGADVIFGVGGRTGEGAVMAASEAGLWAIGSEQDRYYTIGPGRSYVLTSIVPDAGRSVRELLPAVKAGTAPGEFRGRMTWAPYHEAERFISPSMQDTLMKLEQALESGNLVTNVPAHAPR